MGFRSRRRHRSDKGNFNWTGEANGLQPGDDVGNRKSFKPVLVPPEDIGNRRDPDEEEEIPREDVGNRIEANPTHELSGILLDLDPKKRKRRAKGGNAPIERVGRYVVGGVNPLIAGGNRPLPPAPEFSDDDRSNDGQDNDRDDSQDDRGDRQGRGDRQDRQDRGQDDRGDQPRRSERKRRFEQVDGAVAQEVSERRVQRFFDFEEDDRFEYNLKSTPDQKRSDALRFVDDVLREAGRNAVIHAKVIDDGDKPKLLVTIEEKGPHARVPAERVGEGSADPLFVLGNGALLSLNYLVNKVVNRYPDDRIRLAVLPASDEALYLAALAEHRKQQRIKAGETAATVAALTGNAGADVGDASEALEAPKARRGRSPKVPKAIVDGTAQMAGSDGMSTVSTPGLMPAVEPMVEDSVVPLEPIEPEIDTVPESDAPKKRGRKAAPKEEAPAPAPAPVAEAPSKAAPAKAPAKVVAKAPVKAPAKGRGGRTKKSEEIIPSPEELARMPDEDEAPKRGRRKSAAAEEAEAMESTKGASVALDDGSKPRRPRRSSALVEVVRVGGKKS